jgi:hypothetical protein
VRESEGSSDVGSGDLGRGHCCFLRCTARRVQEFEWPLGSPGDVSGQVGGWRRVQADTGAALFLSGLHPDRGIILTTRGSCVLSLSAVLAPSRELGSHMSCVC